MALRAGLVEPLDRQALALDLVALGPVLVLKPCRRWLSLCPSCPGVDELALEGLLRAHSASLERIPMPHPVGEVLWCLDRAGTPSFGLAVLPDSDLFAWDRLVDRIRPAVVSPRSGPLASGTRGVARIRAGIRVFDLSPVPAYPMLCLQPAPRLSPAGRQQALRLVRALALQPDAATRAWLAAPATSGVAGEAYAAVGMRSSMRVVRPPERPPSGMVT